MKTLKLWTFNRLLHSTQKLTKLYKYYFNITNKLGVFLVEEKFMRILNIAVNRFFIPQYVMSIIFFIISISSSSYSPFGYIRSWVILPFVTFAGYSSFGYFHHPVILPLVTFEVQFFCRSLILLSVILPFVIRCSVFRHSVILRSVSRRSVAQS
jgi:hypothetical protein